MATMKAIEAQVSSFGTIFNRALGKEELAMLIISWGKAFADISDVEFVEACEYVKKTSKFFPVPANVVEAIEQNRKNIRPKPIQALPEGEQAKAEDKWRSLIASKVCMKSITSKKRCPLAEVALDITRPWEERERAAREFLGKYFPERRG